MNRRANRTQGDRRLNPPLIREYFTSAKDRRDFPKLEMNDSRDFSMLIWVIAGIEVLAGAFLLLAGNL